MPYCPNCSAYQYDPESKTCVKCGFDLSNYQNKEPEPELDVPVRKKIPELGFSTRRTCKRCNSPTRDIKGEVEIDVEGSRMSIRGLKLMGGEITKVPLTRYTYMMDGYECKEGHKFFSEFKCRIRPLCPVCYNAMMKYGSSLYSCSRCNKHFPVDNWVEPDELEVLMDHGWSPIPES